MAQSDYLTYRKNAMKWYNLNELPSVLDGHDYIQLKQFSAMNVIQNSKNYFGLDNMTSMVASDGSNLNGGGYSQINIMNLEMNDLFLKRYLPLGGGVISYSCNIPQTSANRNPVTMTNADPRPTRRWIKYIPWKKTDKYAMCVSQHDACAHRSLFYPKKQVPWTNPRYFPTRTVLFDQ